MVQERYFEHLQRVDAPTLHGYFWIDLEAQMFAARIAEQTGMYARETAIIGRPHLTTLFVRAYKVAGISDNQFPKADRRRHKTHMKIFALDEIIEECDEVSRTIKNEITRAHDLALTRLRYLPSAHPLQDGMGELNDWLNQLSPETSARMREMIKRCEQHGYLPTANEQREMLTQYVLSYTKHREDDPPSELILFPRPEQ